MDEPAQKINVKVNSKPAVDSGAVASEPLDSAMTEAINAIEISEDGKLTNVAKSAEPAKPAEAKTDDVSPQPAAGLPAEPTTPAVKDEQLEQPALAAGTDNLPKFGALQPKIDEHPLFSGAKEPALKNPGKKSLLKRTFAPLIALLIIIIVGYLLIDSGVVKGASHLPFHVFKQPTVATTPVITTQNTTSPKTTTPTTTDPYAGWQSYCDPTAKLCFKYPADWTESSSVGTGNQINITSADKTANIVFGLLAGTVHSDLVEGFYATSINDLNPVNANYKVAGGYYTSDPNNRPVYALLDISAASQLKMGSQGSLSPSPSFSYGDGKSQANATLTYINGPTKLTADQAVAWLNSDSAKTGLKILQSYTAQ